MVRPGIGTKHINKEEEDGYDSDSVIVKEPEKVKPINQYFFPITIHWMRESCKKLNLPAPRKAICRKLKRYKTLTIPKETIPIKGDGNCWFRSISVWMTGNEDSHAQIRSALVKAYREDKQIRAIIGNADAYIKTMKIDRDGTWATEFEIITTAMLLKRNIHVYSKSGLGYKWRLFGKNGSFKDGTRPTEKCLYIEHVNNNHFQVVKSVIPDLTKKVVRKRKWYY